MNFTNFINFKNFKELSDSNSAGISRVRNKFLSALLK